MSVRSKTLLLYAWTSVIKCKPGEGVETLAVSLKMNYINAPAWTYLERQNCSKLYQCDVTKGHSRTPSDVEFRELTWRDAKESMHNELYKLLNTAKTERREHIRSELDSFEVLYSRFLGEADTSINWGKIQLLPFGAVKPYDDLVGETSPSLIKNMLNKLVVLKLNGGLGTSMGCTGPKSLICVRNSLTFLDLTIQQIENLNKTYDTDVPLVLMNSFNTDEDTEKILRKYAQMKVKIHTFNQSRYPRINRESLLPIAKNIEDNEGSYPSSTLKSSDCWYPPGHGDVYQSFYNSGLLKQLIDEGKEYVFVSNIDNLGATVDISILKFLLDQPNSVSRDFVMEVTDKTRADVKGGTLVEYEGKLRLLEIAQVPKEHVDEFKSVSKFKIFNTNNLWINMRAIQRVVDERTLHMEVIVNPKTLDCGLNVLQLETAVGAAIMNFDGAIGINVPRKRFRPVKTTSDLLIMMSNLTCLKGGMIDMNTLRSFPSVPLVKLGHCFKKVKDFLERFANIPDLLELDHLTVSGDVTFGRNVTLKGTVIIIANHGDRIDIPPGAVLENKIVSGNLRILDH